jgi:hypothetical protein
MRQIKSVATGLATTVAAIGVALLASVSAAHAAPITLPAGLNPGDQYRLAFVTSINRDATSLDIADYNAFVTAVALGVPELAALGAAWTAIASTAAIDARDNTGTNPNDGVGVPIFLLDGLTQVASDNADLWDGTIGGPLNVDENGNAPGAAPPEVWTGSLATGIALAPLGSDAPTTGLSTAADADWVQFVAFLQAVELPFYALSDILTVQAPAPGATLLFGFGLAGLLAWRLRHRRDPAAISPPF